MNCGSNAQRTSQKPQVARTSPATLLSNAGFIPFSESTNNPTGIGPTEDDVSLIWLNDSSKTLDAVNILESNADPVTGIP